ncbi:EamA family transporter [Fibrella forsythiae]|uniref:EamA family transporter n=1 Tax=Fibrella forsythiae TaxID=2817061 RepID=A0ABS3JCE9_9BACT|nr:EamA family transporter [Fibrella forsythiae]MBO0947662.1 EamA family transporter [Fibrella forsythiae]
MAVSIDSAPATVTSGTRLWLSLAAVYVLWGSTYLFIHFMTEQMPPLYMASMRYIVAGSILYAYARFTGTERPTLAHWKSTSIIGFFLLTVANGALTLALQYIPSGVGALLGGLLPIFLLLLNWVSFGQVRPKNLSLIGVAIGFTGIYLLIKPDKMVSSGGADANLIGTVLVAIGNLSWAVGTLLTPRLQQPNQTLASGMQMLMGGLLLMVISLIFEPVNLFSITHAPVKALGSMLYLVIFGSIIGFSAYAWLARHAPPALLATYAFVNPIIAVLLGVTFAGEVFSARSLIGAGVALIGVTLMTLGRR